MKFGEILQKHQRPGWRYLNYALLKRIISEMMAGKPEQFQAALHAEIGAVSAFFKRVQDTLTEKAAAYAIEEQTPRPRRLSQLSVVVSNLRTFSALNYLAVLKIVKKVRVRLDP